MVMLDHSGNECRERCLMTEVWGTPVRRCYQDDGEPAKEEERLSPSETEGDGNESGVLKASPTETGSDSG